MKKNILRNGLFIALISILMAGLSSCTKYSFMPVEDKIVGVWHFESVKLTKGFTLARRDVTKDYIDWEYEFSDDGRFYMRKIGTATEYSGRWTIVQNTVYNSSTQTYDDVRTAHMSVYNPDTEDIEQIVWEISGLTAKRLRTVEFFTNETWYYKLVRM